MNVIVSILPPLLDSLLEEFAGRAVTGVWTNPAGVVVIDIKCSADEYEDLRIRSGIVIWGAWDNGERIEALVNFSDLHPPVDFIDVNGNPVHSIRGLNDVHKWFGDEDKT